VGEGGRGKCGDMRQGGCGVWVLYMYGEGLVRLIFSKLGVMLILCHISGYIPC
jgi:hypothetical protein